MKLELKHLAPYLPYRIPFWSDAHNKRRVLSTEQLDGLWRINGSINSSLCKPILRPLSDLTKEIEHNGEKFVPSKILFPQTELEKEIGALGHTAEARNLMHGIKANDVCYPYSLFQKLFEWHFDVFGLIDKGLAIDTNTIKPTP